MQVVVDTNVLISGTFWKGASARVILLVEKGVIVLVLSEAVLEEYDEIMHSEEIKNKVQHHQERIQAIQKVLQLGRLTVPTERITFVKNDPDDNKFLEAAVTGRAQYIISQDKHLPTLKEFRGIKILKPEEFLNLFKK